jgi:hypothetical protein
VTEFEPFEAAAFIRGMLDGVAAEARGDHMQTRPVAPKGRLCLGRLAPEVVVQNSRLGDGETVGQPLHGRDRGRIAGPPMVHPREFRQLDRLALPAPGAAVRRVELADAFRPGHLDVQSQRPVGFLVFARWIPPGAAPRIGARSRRGRRS